MGNIECSNGGGDIIENITAAEVLQLVAREEAQRRIRLPVVPADQPIPGEGELSSRLSALGVDIGEASVEGAGEKKNVFLFRSTALRSRRD